MKKNIITCLFFGFFVGLVSVANADGTESLIKPPQELFSGRESRIGDIPEDWAVTNQIRMNICFNLKHKINSPEANAFLKELYSTLNSFDYDMQMSIYRTMYPVGFDYCIELKFPNWNEALSYETSEEFLSYYKSKWKPVVTETTEHWTVLDTRVSEK